MRAPPRTGRYQSAAAISPPDVPLSNNGPNSKVLQEMTKNTTRVVTRASDGTLRIRDYPSPDALLKMHTQIGIDDCSTDLAIRGMPVFRGLIGPMPEGSDVVRYESPEVFETLTKEWSISKPTRRTRRDRPRVTSGHLEG